MKKFVFDTVVSIAKERVGKIADKVIDLVVAKHEEPVRDKRRRRGTGSIYQTKGGRWCADIRLDGKRHYASFVSKEEAQAFLYNLRQQPVEQPELPLENADITVESTFVKVPACSWIYDKDTRKARYVSHSTRVDAAKTVVLDVAPFPDDALVPLTGRILYKPNYCSMMIVATSYGRVFCCTSSVGYDPKQLLFDGWVFLDTNMPFGVINNEEQITQ